VSTLQKRIKKRNRAMERNMDPDYLADLIERYDHHFFHYKACPVLIINTDNIDFVENPRDLENLINTIENVPSGVYVYTPESLQ
jgi:deoxyguanosine kinase